MILAAYNGHFESWFLVIYKDQESQETVCPGMRSSRLARPSSCEYADVTPLDATGVRPRLRHYDVVLSSDVYTCHIARTASYHLLTLSNEHKQPCQVCVKLILFVCDFLLCSTGHTSFAGRNHCDENRTPRNRIFALSAPGRLREKVGWDR
jgi:hypothetical protein